MPGWVVLWNRKEHYVAAGADHSLCNQQYIDRSWPRYPTVSHPGSYCRTCARMLNRA